MPINLFQKTIPKNFLFSKERKFPNSFYEVRFDSKTR